MVNRIHYCDSCKKEITSNSYLVDMFYMRYSSSKSEYDNSIGDSTGYLNTSKELCEDCFNTIRRIFETEDK